MQFNLSSQAGKTFQQLQSVVDLAGALTLVLSNPDTTIENIKAAGEALRAELQLTEEQDIAYKQALQMIVDVNDGRKKLDADVMAYNNSFAQLRQDQSRTKALMSEAEEREKRVKKREDDVTEREDNVQNDEENFQESVDKVTERERVATAREEAATRREAAALAWENRLKAAVTPPVTVDQQA